MGAFTYPRSEPGSGGHQDLIERLNAIPQALRREASGLPESTLSYRPAEGEWSMREVTGHLCDDARFLHERLHRIIKLEDPRLPSWDQEEALRQRDPQSKPFEALLEEFIATRNETVDMLAGLVHWNWARTGRHEEHGKISIRQLVDRAIVHEEGHVDQVRRITEAALTATAG